MNAAFRAAAGSGPLQGVMDVLDEECPSARIIGDPHGSIIDLPLTQVLDGTLLTIAAWYDNEIGFATQLARTAAVLAQGRG
jgi:glyceraldehyde 3-phosphate dehydrogenase